MAYLDEDIPIGLDYGTTFSCIGVYRNGGVEIIPNRIGEKTTPSIVTIIDEDNILKGEETLDHLVKDYDSTIYAAKRFIGRDLKDEKVKEEIKIEDFPYNIIFDEKMRYPVVEVNRNNKNLRFSFEEISSFIIRKMIENAENYLNEKVKKIVITVPANFNDAQRKCIKHAANLSDVEVIRIINEPTAAALTYGLQEKYNGKNGNILIFDLGGGTFDVTILNITNIKKEHIEQSFKILSTNGDKFLGGEDFDNKLVEYVLNIFCTNNGIKMEEVKKNKKAIKKLKISCEYIKRILSSNKETTLCLNNFYDNKDIFQKISSQEFNKLSEDLINRLEKPINEALADAKLNYNEISEIVLVGGSTRLPRVRTFLSKKFKNIKINDTINPDETVAYGATLMAAKILIKRESILQGFTLMDITPLSLGVEILNDSKNEEIRKEGGIMSVIIKRGSQLPCSREREYQTTSDNQESASIIIYEGEKKYVKNNHILGRVDLKGLTKKPKGEVKIQIILNIDVNGMLTVQGIEKNKDGKENKIEAKITNETIKLNDKQIAKLKEKNEKYQYYDYKTKLDYKDLKENLKDLQNEFKICNDNKEKFNILNNYNEYLEEFIDLFDSDFDNETVIEKYYMYVKELFISYSQILNIRDQIEKNIEKEKHIIDKIKGYIDIFCEKSSGYLSDLVEIIKDIPKNLFYKIIVLIMAKFNECGKNCLKEMKKFCRHNSLIYFENTLIYFQKYIIDLKNIQKNYEIDLYKKCKEELESANSFKNAINSDIFLCENCIKLGKLIAPGNMSGFSLRIKGLAILSTNKIDNNAVERYKIVLSNYEKMLSGFELKKQEKEQAICLANIIKINYKLLGYNNYKLYLQLGEKCKWIADRLKIDKNIEWYKEFLEIYQELKNTHKIITQNEIKDKIKEKYKNKFDEIDEKFRKRKNNIEFIEYILLNKPYPEYEDDKNNGKFDFKKESQELLKYLSMKYHPDNYKMSEDDEQLQLDYFLIGHIDALINKIYEEN